MGMIEKVAKAMYLAYANHPDARWDYVDPRMQEGVWKLQARAALKAMLEPDFDVKIAGTEAITEDHMRSMANYDAAVDCWQAMIRKALEEE